LYADVDTTYHDDSDANMIATKLQEALLPIELLEQITGDNP
jgi:hypothetical protein